MGNLPPLLAPHARSPSLSHRSSPDAARGGHEPEPIRGAAKVRGPADAAAAAADAASGSERGGPRRTRSSTRAHGSQAAALPGAGRGLAPGGTGPGGRGARRALAHALRGVLNGIRVSRGSIPRRGGGIGGGAGSRMGSNRDRIAGTKEAIMERVVMERGSVGRRSPSERPGTALGGGSCGSRWRRGQRAGPVRMDLSAGRHRIYRPVGMDVPVSVGMVMSVSAV